MAKGGRVSTDASRNGARVDPKPAWALRLDRLFSRRNTLDGLMQSISEEPEAGTPPLALARQLVPIFVSTPWPHQELPETIAARMLDMPLAEREKALLRWKQVFYHLVLRDHAAREPAESPHPFHGIMLKAGHPEYAQLFRQWVIDGEIAMLYKHREDRLRKARDSGRDMKESFFMKYHYNRTMLRIQKIESEYILKEIRKNGTSKPGDPGR